MSDIHYPQQRTSSRRTVAKGIAWTVPTIMIAAATPAFASPSFTPTPGIDGWVYNELNHGCSRWSVTSHRSGCPTPGADGCARGLYTQGVAHASDIPTATITELVATKNSSTPAGVSWESGQGGCWGDPTAGSNVQIGSDWYTPYTWAYGLNGAGCGVTTNCSLSCYSCTPTSPYFCFSAFNTEGTLARSGSVSFYTERTVTLTDSTALSFRRPLTLSCDEGVGYVARPEASKGVDTSPSKKPVLATRTGTSGAS